MSIKTTQLFDIINLMLILNGTSEKDKTYIFFCRFRDIQKREIVLCNKKNLLTRSQQLL